MKTTLTSALAGAAVLLWSHGAHAVPDLWDCPSSWYDDGYYCDCGCAAYDADCDDPSTVDYNAHCPGGTTCSRGDDFCVGGSESGGLTIGSWGTNCWSSTNDADSDGLNDSCEQDLAYWFGPWYWLDPGEDTEAWRPYFAVKSLSYAQKSVRIFYMHTYYRDGGDFLGITSHDGDPEFTVLQAHYGSGKWHLDWVYMSAHRNHSTDASAWYHYSEVEIASSSPARGWPVVYVAENKHANYRNLSECDDGGFLGSDHCGTDTGRYYPTFVARNVGGQLNKLINYVYHRGTYEYLLDNVIFCGWEQTGSISSRSGCSNGYDDHLGDFEID